MKTVFDVLRQPLVIGALRSEPPHCGWYVFRQPLVLW